MPSQQFVILSREQSADNGMAAIGQREEIITELAHRNTAPEQEGEEIFHGPGIQIEITPGQDPITQMLLSITDEDIGWLVLMRFAKDFNWKVLDPNTGRQLQP